MTNEEVIGLLSQMIRRVQATADQDFGGIVMVIPPQGDAHDQDQPIQILLVDPQRDIANFWSTAKAKIDVAVAEFQMQQQRPNMGFGR